MPQLQTTATAALPPSSFSKSVPGCLRSHDFGDERFSRRRNRPVTSQVRKGPLDHLNRPFDKVDGCKLRERLHTPKTNWCSRPQGDNPASSGKRSINPPAYEKPNPIFIALLGDEAIVHVSNALAQVVQHRVDCSAEVLGFTEFFITGHLSRIASRRRG